jgi:small GTP-binding protein
MTPCAFLAVTEAHARLLTESELHTAALLRLRLRGLGALASDQPRIGLLGAFKAGKSTLINALLGGTHAATDDLELTAVTAVYLPGPGQYVRLETAGGEDRVVSMSTWRERAATVRQDPGWWADLVLAEVPTGEGATLTLVDTPGMGVFTPGRADRARAALGLCDAVIWVLSADRLGDAEEGQLLRQLQRTGLPLLLVLNKVDLLEEAEVEEALEWVHDAFPWAKARTYPVRAREAEGSVTAGRIPAVGTGLPALVAAIEALQRDPLALRAQARSAVEADIAQAVEGLRSRIRTRLTPEVEKRARGLAVLQRRAELVSRRVADRLRERVDTGFLSDLEFQLSTSDGPTDLRARVNSALASSESAGFWGRLVEELPGTLLEEWQLALGDIETELQGALDSFTMDFTGALAPRLEARMMQLDQAVDAQTAKDGGLVAAAAVAGAGYVAWLGPAAAAVSFGTALSVVALPVVALGGGIVLAKRHWDKKRAAETLGVEVRSLIAEARARAWAGFVEPVLLPRLAELHGQVTQDAARALGADELPQMEALLHAVGGASGVSEGPRRLDTPS